MVNSLYKRFRLRFIISSVYFLKVFVLYQEKHGLYFIKSRTFAKGFVRLDKNQMFSTTANTKNKVLKQYEV